MKTRLPNPPAERISAPWSIPGLWIPQLGLPAILQTVCRPRFELLRRLFTGHCVAASSSPPVPRPFVVIANSDDDFADRVEGISNDFQPLQGDWVQVAPYGTFPHPRGLQYFAKADAEKLVANFGSFKAKLLRRWSGLPWYEGHPDTSPKDYPNKRSYGWIDNVEARTDGLYAHVKWTKAGEELIAEGHYKYFSPVWHATPANVGGKSVLRPDELISVGFTNTPNMPVLPLSNEESAPINEDMKYHPEILKTLGFAEGATPSDEEVVAAWAKHTEQFENAIASAARADTLANEKQSAEQLLANEREAHTLALENEKKNVANLQKQATDASAAFDSERTERIELIVSSAVANGKITKADADKWREDLKGDFAGKSVELANVKPTISNEVLTRDLGKNQAALEQGATPAQQAKALANEIVQKEGVKFEAAWLRVKKDRKDLFQGMKQPAGKS